MSDKMLQTAIRRLKASGYRLTSARRTVLELLCQHEDHLTSAELLELVEARGEGVGRASVFRTLDLLTELAIIRPTYLQLSTPHYIVMPESGHHAHIICPQCSRVTEIDECAIEDLLHALGSQYNIEFSGHVLELYGKCEQCR